MKPYPIQLEIAGPAALFTRPDTLPVPTSYPAPTYSQAKGLLEAILFQRSVEVRPARVEICAPLVFQRYSTNYGGPLRKSDQVKDDNNYQLLATILINVRYVIHADLIATGQGEAGVNHTHAFQERFYRRLEEGRWWRTPCLGWSEFVPDYLGRRRPDTKPLGDLNLTIPAMLHSVWTKSHGGGAKARYEQNVEIKGGVLTYAQ